MNAAVLLLNFGEPEHATLQEVTAFLERIFVTNASLDPTDRTGEQIMTRARALAEARAPGLIEEYEAIGGSPLHRQAAEQAELLERELKARGHSSTVLGAMQFTPPYVEDVARQAIRSGARKVIGLPVYPLCGPSTTVAALEELSRVARAEGFVGEYHEISGWHTHPEYVQLRADGIRDVLGKSGLSFDDPHTRLVFSAHGTPVKYLEEGSRYDRYVREHCRALAAAAGAGDYALGYQNHANRPVEWTQPEIGAVIGGLDAERVVVVPVSFMHEQSETLAELDIELKELAEGRGLTFHRVPIPYAAPRFIGVLADLVEPFLAPGAPPKDCRVAGLPLGQCVCRPTPSTCCLAASSSRE